MEYIHGKHTYTLDATDFAARLHGYQQIVMDMGTGDGRYVAYVARRFPERFVIGIDTCRENLQQVSKKSLPNALYLIANAEALPVELSKEPRELCNDRLSASRFQLHFSRVLYTF